MSENATTVMPIKKRFQFSLLSLLCIVIALGATMGFVFSRWETNRLLVENRKLREELGVLNIDDPTKYYARSLPVNDTMHWRWRIYFPKHRQYMIKVQTAQIGEEGFRLSSGSSFSVEVDKGEYTFEAEARQGKPGWADIHIQTNTGIFKTSVDTTQSGFDDWAAGSNSLRQLEKGSTAYDPEKPLELLRLRAQKRISPSTTTSVSEPSPGILIWIEPN